MTDHDGWDHHDPDHDDPGHDDPMRDDPAYGQHPDPEVLPGDDLTPEFTADHGWAEPPAEPGHELHLPDEHHAGEHHAEDVPAHPEIPEPAAELAGADVVGADPDAVPDLGDDPMDVFPPALDVGPLPEPVDGFPWIDTGSLAEPGPPPPAADTPDPHELADYAAVDLPPGQDPWAALAASDDPATSALADFYTPPDA